MLKEVLTAEMFCTAIANNCCPYTHIQNCFLILSDLFLDMLAFKITEFNFTHTHTQFETVE